MADDYRVRNYQDDMDSDTGTEGNRVQDDIITEEETDDLARRRIYRIFRKTRTSRITIGEKHGTHKNPISLLVLPLEPLSYSAALISLLLPLPCLVPGR